VHHWENSLRLAETRAGGCFVLSGICGVHSAIAGLAAIAGARVKERRDSSLTRKLQSRLYAGSTGGTGSDA